MMDLNDVRHLKLGISSCLLGEAVRFDGNHKLDAYIVGTLGRFFEFVPICPEIAVGLGVPRPAIRLEGNPEHPRLVGVHDKNLDATDAIEAFSTRQLQTLNEISGYILKSKSPSCGMERVKVYGENSQVGHGSGLFARALMTAYPLIPVEEEGRLGDPNLRDNFLERLFAYRRWQNLEASGLTRPALIHFHTIHKLSLMAHGLEAYRRLGRMIAAAGKRPLRPLAGEYMETFMRALKHPATIKLQTNVLYHLMGYLKDSLQQEDKAELLEVIGAYRQERIPLVVPIILLKHHFRHHPHLYIAEQVYLNPPPEEMLLRRGGL
ncbi:YbgA family protein [Thiohalomonas denitrificans]|uniref:YbgA family protein n=1 Tax=Thiohalomonas denitrificans TaxID=415747 RepID=UPI0026EF5B2D|nr:DUF523 and DUF1722 domain-containing protein [Thiohalomonas denitrificans]